MTLFRELPDWSKPQRWTAGGSVLLLVLIGCLGVSLLISSAVWASPPKQGGADSAGDSALLRKDNRGVCQACHQK